MRRTRALTVLWIVLALGIGCSVADDAQDDDTDEPDTGEPQWIPLDGLEFYPVFEGGDGLYHTYRIPSIVRTTSGVLLAFAEGRGDEWYDKSQNDIVLRRSLDDGVHWAPIVVLHDVGEVSLNDPTAVQIRTGEHTGRVLLMFESIPCINTSPEECVEIDGGETSNFLMYSDDDGETWSEPADITAFAGGGGVGPGLAIQKTLDPAAGRVLFPFRGLESTNFALYSDDGGDTWTQGGEPDTDATVGAGNEVQLVELSDGRLQLNARNTDDTGFRKVAWSENGGHTWSALEDDDELVDSQVMASLLCFSTTADSDRDRLLFSNPAHPDVRVQGTVRMSYDDGETWPVSREVFDLVFGYSVLVKLDCKNVGLLFEEGINTQSIQFARFPLAWLTEGDDDPACF